MKILIVGAGVAGLAIGWRLAQAGAKVDAIERGRAGRAATWAAAGMIAPGLEVQGEANPLAGLARRSHAAWPGFAAEIEAASGMRIGFRSLGSLILATNAGEAVRLREERHAGAKWLAPAELQKRAPILSPPLLGALHVASDADVDNRALGEALSRALTGAGGVLRETCELRTLIESGGRIRGALTDAGMIEADVVVLASGAWLNRLAGIDAATLPPIAPVKGQMIALKPPDAAMLPQTLLWQTDAYMVPRDGRLLVGATVEDAGFDTSVTRDARDRLFAAASATIPAAKDWRVAEAWSGLRPKAPDGLPVLGESRIANLFVASGQFRHGILLAPLVADILRSAVLRETLSAEDSAFDPKRFG